MSVLNRHLSRNVVQVRLQSRANARPMPKHMSTSQASPNADLRTLILTTALKHIPKHGFSLRALQAAASDIPSLQSFASSAMSVEQLFPSLPERSLPSFLQQKTVSKSVSPDEPISETERLGPVRALFDAWTDDKRTELQKYASELQAKGPSAVKDALKTRLEYNIPVLPYLPQTIASLALPDPVKASLPSVRPYLTHVKQIAKDVKDFTRAEASLARLTMIYSMSEVYQISSPTNPSIEEVKRYLDDLYESTKEYDSTIRDVAQFGGYVVDSWKNIWNSRGF